MIRIEHAIFTSNASITGQGYRVVAGSAGLDAQDEKRIALMSPSHDGMCDKSAAATGLAFYPLGHQRHALAHTNYAGHEQTGRGGRRVLTHVFALTAQQLAEFHNNPFCVLRALTGIGAFENESHRGSTLEPLSLEPAVENGAETMESAFDALQESAMLYLISNAMSDGRLIVAGIDRAPEVIEGVLLALPGSSRLECSFSIGLKFSLARTYRLCLIGCDMTTTRNAIRGHGITLADNLHGGSIPDHETSPWLEMIADSRRTGRLSDLLALTGESFDDADADAIQRIALRQIECNRLGEAGIDELLDLAAGRGANPRCTVERWLADRCANYAKRRLTVVLLAARQSEIRRCWPRLTVIAASDPDFAALCSRLEGRRADNDSSPERESEVARAEQTPAR